MTIVIFDLTISSLFILLTNTDFIFSDFLFLSEIILNCFMSNGALGQTRTGTPQAAKILSPLCLPISPWGFPDFHYSINIYSYFYYKKQHQTEIIDQQSFFYNLEKYSKYHNYDHS